jgi:hypothetical protein
MAEEVRSRLRSSLTVPCYEPTHALALDFPTIELSREEESPKSYLGAPISKAARKTSPIGFPWVSARVQLGSKQEKSRTAGNNATGGPANQLGSKRLQLNKGSGATPFRLRDLDCGDVISTPTAPTSFLIHFTGLAKTARQQKAALTAGQRRRDQTDFLYQGE